jgi:hypothetical protein
LDENHHNDEMRRLQRTYDDDDNNTDDKCIRESTEIFVNRQNHDEHVKVGVDADIDTVTDTDTDTLIGCNDDDYYMPGVLLNWDDVPRRAQSSLRSDNSDDDLTSASTLDTDATESMPPSPTSLVQPGFRPGLLWSPIESKSAPNARNLAPNWRDDEGNDDDTEDDDWEEKLVGALSLA